MTVIAWDGQTLAGDRRFARGQDIASCRKIFRITVSGNDHPEWQGALMGFAGNLDGGMEMVRWFEKCGMEPEKFPECQTKEDYAIVMVVRKDKTIWLFEQTPSPAQVLDPFYAIGGGCHGAMCLMHTGMPSAIAIDIVSLYNNSCGGGIDQLSHEVVKSDETRTTRRRRN